MNDFPRIDWISIRSMIAHPAYFEIAAVHEGLDVADFIDKHRRTMGQVAGIPTWRLYSDAFRRAA